jgi:hypothetical protein
LTEEEAKTKICHRTLGLQPIFIPFPPGLASREGEGTVREVMQKCIGSACMAWRAGYDYATHAIGQSLSEPPRAGVHVEDGHCGLAGKP